MGVGGAPGGVSDQRGFEGEVDADRRGGGGKGGGCGRGVRGWGGVLRGEAGAGEE
eukprot:CAMPEP_0114144240 /NCGR_PEP_ID=MMETSP0043_2-20121206/19408_1 /TAXON_ID=464988 /ORGANISM="Hemiselmis andersenii, Strain CCMP644" /LENGTH=54 /DNA_ID=CAMNT_0001238579 /DNA_START=185 /DNA_END=346 /DNA_ORIENTATION=+